MCQTPLTNDSSEIELATCGETIKKDGSTVSFKTISNHHKIVRNELFSEEKWKSLTITKKKTYLTVSLVKEKVIYGKS